MSIQKLDKNNFNSILKNADKPIIVDFYAEWCGPCKMMAPVMEEIARSNANVDVYRVDVDENPDLAMEFSIMSIPTIISFKDAKPYKTAIGAQGMPNILKLIQ